MGENLWAISIDPDESMREYVLLQLKVKPMRDLLFRSRIFTYLAAATPGLKELVTIGKIWELALERPQVARTAAATTWSIVDAPATGHGVGFLQTPRTFAELARVGPIRQQAETLDAFIRDPERTGVAVVALPEEMPVNETVALERDLAERGRARGRPHLLQRALPGALRRAPRSSGSRPRSASADDGARAACRAALTEYRRAGDQRLQLARLEENCEAPVSTLPYLFEPELGARADRGAGDGAWPSDGRHRRAARGQADLRLRRLGRGRQDDHRGGDRRRDGRPGQARRGADDRPGEAARRLARAARARQHRAPGRPGAVRRRRGRDRGRRALGDDARREADLRRGRPRARARRPRPASGSSPTASTSSSPRRSPARRSTWRWRSSTRSTPRAATTCSSSTRRRRATRSTSSTRRTGSLQFIEGRALQVFMKPTGFGMRVFGRGRLDDVLGPAPDHRGRPARGPGRVLPGVQRHGRRLSRARPAGQRAARRPETSFLVVCAPQGEPITEAVYFHRKLEQARDAVRRRDRQQGPLRGRARASAPSAERARPSCSATRTSPTGSAPTSRTSGARRRATGATSSGSRAELGDAAP